MEIAPRTELDEEAARASGPGAEEPEPREPDPAASEPGAEGLFPGEPGDVGDDEGDGAGAEPARLGPGEELDDDELARRAAALLFASPDPLSLARLVELLERPARARVRAALAEVARRLEAAGLSIVLREVAGGWRFLTSPAAGEVVQRLLKEPRPERVSAAGLETLAIIAYRQPVTKAEIEAIRGVQSQAMLRSLVDRGLVRVTGRSDQPGAPLLYGTTRQFLERFGLARVEDLPRDGELA